MFDREISLAKSTLMPMLVAPMKLDYMTVMLSEFTMERPQP